jgi:hypothetical protein
MMKLPWLMADRTVVNFLMFLDTLSVPLFLACYWQQLNLQITNEQTAGLKALPQWYQSVALVWLLAVQKYGLVP